MTTRAIAVSKIVITWADDTDTAYTPLTYKGDIDNVFVSESAIMFDMYNETVLIPFTQIKKVIFIPKLQ